MKTPTTAYSVCALVVEKEAFIVSAVVGVFTNNFLRTAPAEADHATQKHLPYNPLFVNALRTSYRVGRITFFIKIFLYHR